MWGSLGFWEAGLECVSGFMVAGRAVAIMALGACSN